MNARKILAQTESQTRVLIALTVEEVDCIRDSLLHREQCWKGDPDYGRECLAVRERIERQIAGEGAGS